MSSPERKFSDESVLKYQFDGFELFPLQRALWRSGERISLTPKPLETLLRLVEHAGETVSKDDLVAQIWEGAAVEDNNLTQSVSVLRKALGEKRGENRYILTDPGRGYRFIATVETVREGAPPVPSLSDPVPAVPGSVPALPGPVPGKGRPTRGVLAAAGALTLLFVAGISLAAYHTVPHPAVRRSVAVLRIRDLSKTSTEAWVQTALTEMLTSELAAGGKLRTIPADEVARWHADLGPAAENRPQSDLFRSARQNLGADALVLGSYVVTGTCPDCRVRVDLGLMNAQSGERFGTVIEEGSATDLIDVAGRLGRRLRGEFGITAEIAASPRWPASSAMREYAEGLKALRGIDPLSARDHLQAALAADPENALIHSALADTWAALGYGIRANDEGRRAYELSASLDRLDRLGIEARYRTGVQQWDRAIEAYRAIFQLFPESLDDGLNLARTQVRALRCADAKSTLRLLRRLPAPAGADPRIDMAEAQAAGGMADFPRTRDFAHRAAEEARRRGSRYLFARARLLEGGAMQTLSDPKAFAVQDEARLVCEEIGDRDCVSKAWRIRGNASYFFGDFQQAQEAYSRGVAIEQELGNRAELSNLFAGFGVVAKANRDWPHAESYLNQAVALAVETGGSPSGFETIVAGLYIDTGRLAEAAHAIDVAYESAQRIGARDDIGEVFRLRSLVARANGDLNRAQQFSDQALAELRNTQNNVPLHMALAESSSLSTARGELVRAERELENTGPGAVPEIEGMAQLARAESYSAKGRLADAATEAQQAAALFDKARADERSARAFLVAADALELLHQDDQALTQCREAGTRAARSPNPAASVLARLCEWRLAGDSRELSGPNLQAESRRLKLPELTFASLYAQAMRARRTKVGNPRHLFDELAKEASARGYITLSKRAQSLAAAN